MVVVPTLLVLALVWLPALLTIVLSFFSWNGLGDVSNAKWVGLQNYRDAAQIYPPFWPALRHNVIWLLALFVVTALGVLLAVILDRELPGGRFYQTAFFLPTVLSLA